METTATTFTGHPADRQPGQARLILRPDEHMFGRAWRATLVRLAEPTTVPPPGYGEYSPLASCALATPGPADRQGQQGRSATRSGPVRTGRRVWTRRASESGPVTVTDQRVVFHGALRDWEWSLDQMVDLWHGRSDPLTAIRVGDRAELTGLTYHRAQAPQLRFLLALAIAHHRGEVDPLIGRLTADRATHAKARPVRPSRPRPDAAPGPLRAALDALDAVYLGRPSQPVRWRLAQFAAAVIATTGVVAMLLSGLWLR